jgi:large subunit ribosomal protein L29
VSIARPKDLRNMSSEDVQKKLDDVQAELIRQMGKKTAGGAPENPGRMKELRRTVARIITIQREMAKSEKPKAVKKTTPAEKKEEKPKQVKKAAEGKK